MALAEVQAAIHKHIDHAFFKLGPGFVLGQWGGDDDGDLVLGRGFGGEVHGQVFVGQLGCGEGVAALGVEQVGGGVAPQGLAVGEQEVEGAVWRDTACQLLQGDGELFNAGHTGMGLPQLLHDPAKGQFAVCGAYGAKVRVQLGGKAFEVAIVGKHPVAAPQLTHKGVAVLQADQTLCGLADVGDDVLALDGVVADQLGNGGVNRPVMVHKMAQSLVFKECNAPAVGVIPCVACTLRKAAEAKAHIGWRIAVHS